jgi:hypothetical protein
MNLQILCEICERGFGGAENAVCELGRLCGRPVVERLDGREQGSAVWDVE